MEQKDESYYIERILDGETEYFSVFLDRYSRPLYTLVVQIVGCPEDAEELLQDIFLKAFRNLNRYKGECRFSTWIYRIAYNQFLGKNGKVTGVEVEEVEWTPATDGGRPTMNLTGKKEVIEADMVLLAMGFLKPEQPKFAENVFLAGDAATGASLVVRAMAGGRKAAADIDHYLVK